MLKSEIAQKELVTFDWKNIFSLNYSCGRMCVVQHTDKLIVKNFM